VPFEELHIGPGHVHQGRIPGCSSAVSLDCREKILEMANERTSTLAEYCSSPIPRCGILLLITEKVPCYRGRTS